MKTKKEGTSDWSTSRSVGGLLVRKNVKTCISRIKEIMSKGQYIPEKASLPKVTSHFGLRDPCPILQE